MTADANTPAGSPGTGAIGAGNDLGEEAVVELLVRGFTDHCLSIFQAVAEGGQSLDDGINDINAQADSLNTLFMGRSTIRELTTHPWNSPDQLGVYLRDAMGLDQPPGECVQAALVHLATMIMRAIQAKPEGWQGEVEALRIEMRDLLMGRRPLDDGQSPVDGDTLPM